jgi:hypothetical protein
MKKKLKISDLNVTSFVTSMEKQGGKTLVGGAATQVCIKIGDIPTDPVIGCDPRDSVPSNCTCTGLYPSLNYPCNTLDYPCLG